MVDLSPLQKIICHGLDDAPMDDKMELNGLPPELLFKIFKKLKPADLARTSATCRFFQEITTDNLLWKKQCKRALLHPELPFTSMDFKSYFFQNHLMAEKLYYIVGNTLYGAYENNFTICAPEFYAPDFGKINALNVCKYFEQHIKVFFTKEDAIKYAVTSNLKTTFELPNRKRRAKTRPIFSLCFSDDLYAPLMKLFVNEGDIESNQEIMCNNGGVKRDFIDKLKQHQITIKLYQIEYYGKNPERYLEQYKVNKETRQINLSFEKLEKKEQKTTHCYLM